MDALIDSPPTVAPTEDPWVSELVVPIDGSRFAERAHDVAIDLARRLDVGVARLCCAEAVGAPGSTRRPTGVDLCQWRSVDDFDPPVDVLARLNAERPGLVVCLASHGRSGPGRGPLGRVADAVVRDDRFPVIVVGESCRHHWLEGGGPIIGCLDPDEATGKSERGDLIRRATRRWASVLERDWRLVAVVEPDLVPTFKPRGDVEVIPSRHPAAVVRSLADRSRAALLVMGAHRCRNRCSTSQVLRPVLAGATCPVFVPAG